MPKICTKCKQNKSLSEFYKNKSKKDGFATECKICVNARGKKNWAKNKDTIYKRNRKYILDHLEETKEYHKKYHIENQETIKKRANDWYNDNPERIKARKLVKKDEIKEYQDSYNKEYYKKNTEKLITYQKEYRKDNKPKINKRLRNKYHNDIDYKLIILLRTRITKFIKGSKSKTTREMIGCTLPELKAHLENQFIEDMTWETQGKWHIDHIIPLSKALSEGVIYELNHYTNLQPLWEKSNLSKSNKIML